MPKRRGGFSSGFCGTVRVAPKLPAIKAHCIIDSHMHIQSSKCAPGPLVKNQLKNIKIFDALANLQTRIHGITLGNALEFDIGKAAVEENSETYRQTTESTEFGYFQDSAFAPATTATNAPRQQKENVFTILVSQMMDMEYAHLAGYDGQPIYHTEKDEAFYYKRSSGLAAESQGEKIIDKNGYENLRQWKDQYESTCSSIIANPWRLLSMFHYEPRRWRIESGKREHPKWLNGPWDFPFSKIATKTRPGIFIGFKMYPPLGYNPLDPKLPHLWKYSGSKAECYYGKCELEGIPILTHCSPGGMTTHELEFYKEYFTQQPNKFTATGPSATSPVATSDATRYSAQVDNTREAEEWFYENIVHPKGWRKVLEKFPTLKLCLAHFGGDLWQTKGPVSGWIQEIIKLTTEKDEKDTTKFKYPNVYTDISCWDITNPSVQTAIKEVLRSTPDLRKKLLFGSDWFMTLLVLWNGEYKEYCEAWKHFLDEIDEKLWIRLSLVNPFEFFGLSDDTKLSQINSALKKSIGKPSLVLEKNFAKLLEIRNEVENLKKALEQWDTEGL